MKDKVLQRIKFKDKLRHKHIMEEARLYHRLEIEKMKEENRAELRLMGKEAQTLIIVREIYDTINKTFKLPLDYKDFANLDAKIVSEAKRITASFLNDGRKSNVEKYYLKKIPKEKDENKDT